MRMRLRRLSWVVPVTVSVLLFCSAAFAYQFGTVTRDVDLKQGASGSSPTLSRLVRGSVVTATDQATAGFYKVRAANGSVGYVEAGALSLRPATNTGAAARPQAKQQSSG